MSFKEYINEKSEASFERMVRYMRFTEIPITPKIWEEIFGAKEQYCFQALQLKRMKSLFNRQHKKNQVSTFINFDDTSIFWGPDGLEWNGKSSYTYVAILKGKVTVQSDRDLWTSVEKDGGRRWVDVYELKSRSRTALISNFFIKVRNDTIKNFTKKINNSNYRDYVDISVSDLHAIRFEDNAIGKNVFALPGKDKKEIVKMYFDSTNEALEKNKHLFKTKKTSTVYNHYDEHLCYDYTVKEILIIPEKDEMLNIYKTEITEIKEDISQYISKNKIKAVTEKEAVKILKKYQKMNKENK